MSTGRWIAFGAWLATIVAANWGVEHWGIVRVGFGLSAPAAVLFVGLSFTLRDLARTSRPVMIAGIIGGAVLSYAIAPGFAVASGATFLLSESLDYAIFERLRRRRWLLAVLCSNAAALIVDSIVFLWLAFRSFDFLAGQIVGKTYMTAAAVGVLWIGRNHLSQRRRSSRMAADVHAATT